MLVMDMPDVPPQYGQVMIAQVGAEKQGTVKANRTLGVCKLVENPPMIPGGTAINSLSPILEVKNYFRSKEKRNIEGPSITTVLEHPKHGELKDEGTSVLRHGTVVDTGERGYSYLPARGYLGRDRAVLLIEIAGMKITMVYSFRVVDVIEGSEELCPSPRVRRITFSTPTRTYSLLKARGVDLPR